MRYLYIIAICLIAFVSCKPKDPIMNAAEQFYDKGLITDADLDILKNEYKNSGKLDRTMVVSAIAGVLKGPSWASYPPLDGIASSWEVAPEFVEEMLAENKKKLKFLIDTKFFLPSEIKHLEKMANSPEEFSYRQAIINVALLIMQNENSSPTALKRFASNLLELKILTEPELPNLLLEIDKGALNSEFDLLAATSKSLLIDPNDSISDVRQAIIDMLTKINNQFIFGNIENLKVEIKPIEDFGEMNTVSVSFTSKQLLCTITENINLKLPNTYIPRSACYRIFNQLLEAQGRKDRLHLITREDIEVNRAYNPGSFAFILLTEEQASGLLPVRYTSDNSIRLSEEYFQTIKTNELYLNLLELKKSGLFSHVSDETFEAIANSAVLNSGSFGYSSHLFYVLEEFPDLTYQHDSEMAFLDAPYADLLHDLSRISKGVFTPTEIIDPYDGKANVKEFEVSFKWKGKTFRKMVVMDDDWYDPEFLRYIDNILVNEKIDQFYYQTKLDIVLFVTPEQHRILQKLEKGYY